MPKGDRANLERLLRTAWEKQHRDRMVEDRPSRAETKEPRLRTAFNILAAIAGVFGFGFTLMGTHPVIGLVLMAVSVAYGISELVRSPSITRRLPRWLRVVVGLALCGALLWAAWPQIRKVFRTNPAVGVDLASTGRTVAAETLWEMFNHDFPGTSNWSTPRSYMEADKSTFSITVNLYLDRAANAKFVAFYVPHSKYSYVTSLAFARDVYSAISDVERRFNVTQHVPGQAGVVSESELVFSKRIFLYAEDDFSAEQMGNLTSFYKGKGFDLQIRSNDYVMLQNYKKANP
jgi:hypothetical protein